MELTIKTVHIYMEYCKNWKNLDWKTLKAYNIDLRQFIEFLEREKLPFQKEALTAYTARMNERYKPRTVRRKLASIRALTTWLLNEGRLKRNPFENLRPKLRKAADLPRTIPSRVVARMLAEAHRAAKRGPKSSSALLDAAALEMLFATGLRVSELCGLDARDVDLQGGEIRVSGKGGRERLVCVTNAEVLQTLREYAAARGPVEDGPFFRGKRGGTLSTDAVRALVRKYAELAKYAARVTPHMFRHTLATALLDADVDIRYIQQLLGHASILTTQIYTHVGTAKQRAFMESKHPRNQFSLC